MVESPPGKPYPQDDGRTSFADLLRRYREVAGLTQEALAERARLSWRTISDLERGAKHIPRHDTLDLLIAALCLSSDQALAFRTAGRRQDAGTFAGTDVPQPEEPPFTPRNPYKGLRAFRGEDAGDFFGREDLIASLLTSLSGARSAAPRFLAVIGPSGSGKSSIVMAGLLPRLQRGAIPGSDAWVYLEPVAPGAHPLESLTVALSASLPGSSLTAIRTDLNSSPRGLHLLGRRLALRPGTHVVLIVDQGEELFTLTGDEEERRQFIDLLVTAATEPDGPIQAILTLRADFYERPMNYPTLGTLLEANSRSVLPMSAAALRAAIEQPAALADTRLTFEAGLVDELLFEVHGQAGALPLLEFTLDQLFERRQRQHLTFAAYQNLGGVRGALARHAEATYQELPDDEHRRLARALFLRLIDPGATEQDIARRRASMTELLLADPQQTVHMRAIVDAFVAARLLTSNERAGTTTLEVSHEALIREWGQLGEWLREAREDIRLQQRLSEDVAEWMWRGQPADNLYRGLVLDEALAWADRNTVSASELEFLTAGSAERLRQEAMEEEEQAQRLVLAQQAAAANRRAAQRLRYLAAVLAVSLAIATSLMVFALKTAHDAGVARTVAEVERALAQSRQLAAQAIDHVGDQYDLGLLLGIEANRIARTAEAMDSVLRGLAHDPRLITYLHGDAGALTSIAFSPDGAILASGGCAQAGSQEQCQQGEIQLWDVARRQPLGLPLIGHSRAVYSIAFSPNGRILASGGYDGAIELWDVASRRSLGPLFLNRAYRLYGLVFSPDGTTLACSSDVETIVLWDVRHRQILGAPLIGHTDGVPSIAFSPDGKTLAAGSYDGIMELWDVRSRQRIALPTMSSDAQLESVAYSPDGRILAAGGVGGVVQLWDVRRRQLSGPPLDGHMGGVNSVVFSADGAILAAGSQDGTIRLWSLAHRQVLGAALRGQTGGVSSLAFSANTHILASATQSGAIQLWDVAHWQSLGPALGDHTAGVHSIAYDKGGRILASGNADGTTRVWDITSKRSFILSLPSHAGSVRTVAFNPQGTLVAAGYDEGAVQVWDIARRRPLGLPLIGHSSGVASVAFSPIGTVLASGSDDKAIQLWSMASGQPLGPPLSGHTYGITAIAFSPNGATLASVSYDGTLRLWDVPHRKAQGLPLGHTAALYSVAYSPDGSLLATGSQDGTIQLWDALHRRTLGAPFAGHTGGVTSVAFSPDGMLLASGSDDLTVRLWDVARHQAIGPPLLGHLGGVTSVAFSPDGTLLASGSEDGTIRLSDMKLADWLQQACRIVNRNLARQEWQQYLGNQPYRQTCPAAS